MLKAEMGGGTEVLAELPVREIDPGLITPAATRLRGFAPWR
jgi:hypothetical protein